MAGRGLPLIECAGGALLALAAMLWPDLSFWAMGILWAGAVGLLTDGVWRTIRDTVSFKAAMQKLTTDERYIIQTEDAIYLNTGKQSFGPFNQSTGRYGYLPFDEVRTILARLVDLRIVKVITEGKYVGSYQFTHFGKRVAKALRSLGPQAFQ